MAEATQTAPAKKPRRAKKRKKAAIAAPQVMPQYLVDAFEKFEAQRKAAEVPKKELPAITHDLIATSRIKRRRAFHDAFMAARPKPGVVPADAQTLAMDEAITDSIAWVAQSFYGGAFGDGVTFLGYPYLSELMQRPEYRRISEVIATEMTRKWIRLKASGDGDKSERIKAIQDALVTLKVQDRFRELAELDGAFGRAHLYIDTGDTNDANELTTPIGNGHDAASKGKIGRGAFKRLRTVEPVWCYPAIYNSINPLKPDWYNPSQWFVQGTQIHVSRLITFVSREVPDLLKPAYSFGGLSMSQMAKPYVDNWLRTRQSVSDLVSNFSTMILATDLQSTLAMQGDQLFRRLDLFANLRDNRNVMAVNKDSEELKNISVPLSGLEALQAQSQEHMSSVSGIPLVKLLGIQPAGLNATSEGEIRTFYDNIAALQEKFYRDKLNRVIGFIQLSEFGDVDPDIVFDFVPLWSLSEKEEAEVNKIKAETDAVYVGDIGAVSPEEVRARVASDPQSGYDNLDPADMPEPPDEQTGAAQPDTEGGGANLDESDLAPGPGDDDEGDKGVAKDGVVPFAYDANWNEGDHPRGQPNNAGQFASSGGGGAKPAHAPQYGLIHGAFTATAPKAPAASHNIGAPIDPSKLTKVGAQKGSNPGGVFADAAGTKFYVKAGQSKAHVRNEMTAAALYNLAGTPTLRYRPVDGGEHIATEMAKLDKSRASDLSAEERREAAKDFVVHAWLGNWDAVGMGGDNLGTVHGVPTALDLGGALEYRAQGAPKGKAFGDKVGELETLRDPKMNPDAAAIFGSMTPAQMRESARFVTSLRDSAIKDTVKRMGGSDALADKLIARRDDIAERMKTVGASGDPASPSGTMVVPAGSKMPVKELNGVPFKAWTPPDNWADVDGQADLDEPPIEAPEGKSIASGVIVREKDGRIWLVQPRGGYGGYDATFPKGRAEKDLSLQANAIKEAYEESGLKVKITGFAGDRTGDITHTRYYYAERVGGDPSSHDNETEGVVLVPTKKAAGFLNRSRDRGLLGMDAPWEESKHPRDPDGKFSAGVGALGKEDSHYLATIFGGASQALESMKEKLPGVEKFGPSAITTAIQYAILKGAKNPTGFLHDMHKHLQGETEWPKAAAAAPEKPTTPGSKKELIASMLAKGTTPAEVMKATGWPSVSMPQQALAAGMKLEKIKVDGVTKYKGVPMTPAELAEVKAALKKKVEEKKANKAAPQFVVTGTGPKPAAPAATAKAAPAPAPATSIPPPTAAELEKAKKSVALQPQYVPGYNDLQTATAQSAVQKMVVEFNKKYEGQTITDPALLAKKVAEFKGMQNVVAAVKKNETEHLATIKAKEAAEAQAKAKAMKAEQEKAAKAAAEKNKEYMKELGINEQEAYGFDALVGMMGGKGKDLVQAFKNYENEAKNYGYPISGFQCALVKNYTDGGYHQVNANLRKGSWTEAQHVYVKMVNKAIMSMPSYTGKVHRGSTLNATEQAKYVAGNVVEERAFTSSSISNPFGGNTKFVINAIGKRASHVKKLSHYGHEDEVLFAARTFFKVTKVEGKPGGPMTVHMEEMDD